MSYRVVDLFAGGGGLTLGFAKAGFNVVCAVEKWQPAIEIYKENFKAHPIVNLDLADAEASAKFVAEYKPNVIIGGLHAKTFRALENEMRVLAEPI